MLMSDERRAPPLAFRALLTGLEAAGEDLAQWQRTVTEMKASGSGDFATLSVGLESVRKLAD